MTSRRPSFSIILALWGWASAATLLAIVVGPDLRPTPELESLRFSPNLPWEQFCARDGHHYLRIVTRGYELKRDDLTSVVFFPAYPLIARWLQSLTQLPPIASLMLVSNLSCLTAAWVWSGYVAARSDDEDQGRAFDATLWLLLSPMSLFFRVCYSEALFVLLLAAWLYCAQRRWPYGVLAILAGAVTATRSVGIVLMPVFVWHVWQTAGDLRTVARGLLWTPVAAWGLLAFMTYLAVAHDDPLAFAHGQQEWVRTPLSWGEKVRELLTFEPIWGCYVPQSRHYWASLRKGSTLWNGLDCWNTVYFVVALGLLIGGGVKRWLNTTEFALGSLLLLFPYVMLAAENSMQSQARFTVVNLPLTLVLARWTAQLPSWLRIFVFLGVGSLLVWASILFGSYGFVF